jgi:hypothetical protein
MLQVLLYTEVRLSSEDREFLRKVLGKGGAKLIAIHCEQPPSLGELIEYNPDVVLSGAGARLSPVWSFLLMLRSLRLQGKEWPKAILAAQPTEGRYIPEIDYYDETALDYVYQYQPYCELYDISLDHLLEDIRPCLAILEVEHLAHTAGVRKQWLLADSQTEYGQLTFSHLEYVPLSCPAVVCTFQAESSFDDNLRPLFEQVRSLQAHQCQLRSIGETMQIDELLLVSDEVESCIVEFCIQGTEAKFYLHGLTK